MLLLATCSLHRCAGCGAKPPPEATVAGLTARTCSMSSTSTAASGPRQIAKRSLAMAAALRGPSPRTCSQPPIIVRYSPIVSLAPLASAFGSHARERRGCRASTPWPRRAGRPCFLGLPAGDALARKRPALSRSSGAPALSERTEARRTHNTKENEHVDERKEDEAVGGRGRARRG